MDTSSGPEQIDIDIKEIVKRQFAPTAEQESMTDLDRGRKKLAAGLAEDLIGQDANGPLMRMHYQQVTEDQWRALRDLHPGNDAHGPEGDFKRFLEGRMEEANNKSIALQLEIAEELKKPETKLKFELLRRLVASL